MPARIPSFETPASAAPSRGAALHLRADGLSFSFPDRRVLTDISLVVSAGRPTGLLGENGSGKSTLLQVLAGRLEPTAGTVSAPGPVGLLHQDLPFPTEAGVGEVVTEALSRSRRLEQELAAAGEALAAGDGPGVRTPTPHAVHRYDQLLAEATLADAWNADSRAEIVLATLGLAALDPGTRLAEISGGQRERLALAHLLIARPTTWLLDEPTNHLDDATSAQLDLDPAESPLARPEGGLSVYTGGFSDYLLARFEARDRWEHRFRAEQEELGRLRQAVRESYDVGRENAARTEVRMARKFHADRNATRVSRHLRESRARLAQLEQEQVRKPPAPLHLTHLPAAPRGPGGSAGTVLVSAREVHVRDRLAPVSLSLSAGQQLLITGANGSGKSTLLDVLTGHLPADGGSVSRPRGLRIGHLGQDDHPIPDRTVRAQLHRASGGTEQPAADGAVPELFGLVHPRDLDRPLELLSRGQLRRVMLAAVLLDPPELLVLDEPTNHLALVTATRFEAALAAWDGTLLIASHDRWLRRRWHGEVLHLD